MMTCEFFIKNDLLLKAECILILATPSFNNVEHTDMLQMVVLQ